MADYTVTRGEIHRGKEVVAREGDDYKPKNETEARRLLRIGVIAEQKKRSAQPAKEPAKEPAKGSGGGAGDDKDAKA